MSYSDSFPAQRASFMADFANAGRLDNRLSFTRASTANVFDGSKHLSSDNLFTHSSTFDNAAWSGGGVTKTAGQLDPAGGSNAYTFLENTSSQYHNVYQNVSGNESWSLTVYGKQNTGSRYLQLRFYAAPNNYETAVFDLAGSAPSTASGPSSGFTNVTATQTASGNGFYKCTIKATGNITFAGIHVSQNSTATSLDAYGVTPYTGDNTSSIDIAFASLTTTGATDYNATTTQIHRAYAPSLVSKSNNIGRFDHTTDGQSMGILIEGQSTNLYPYGSDQYNWSGARRLVQSNAAISPAGTLTADLVTLNGDDANTHYVFQYMSVTSGTTYTISQYVKAAGLNYVTLRPNTGFASNLVTFDLSNGTIVSNAGGLGASIEPVGNEWYRISVTATANATVSNATCAIYFSESSSTTVTATGDSYRGILLWGAQWEASSFASSLVDTGTSSSPATRAAESLSVATADIGYTGGPVSLFCEGTAQGENTGGGQVLLGVHKDDDNRIGVWTRRTNKRIALVSGGGVSSSLEESSWYDGKTALSLTTDSLSGSINGRTVLTDTSQPLPDLNGATVYVGNLDSGTAYQMNGHVKRVALYGEALSDENLVSLTS
jgi:hypothetical protein